jgi:hypothetical protein
MNAIDAGKLANGLKIASKVVGGVGVGLAVYDINANGFTTSNSLDLGMSALALSGIGTPVAGGYFVLNTALTLATGKDIGQHIDSYIWTAIPGGIGLMPLVKIK